MKLYSKKEEEWKFEFVLGCYWWSRHWRTPPEHRVPSCRFNPYCHQTTSSWGTLRSSKEILWKGRSCIKMVIPYSCARRVALLFADNLHLIGMDLHGLRSWRLSKSVNHWLISSGSTFKFWRRTGEILSVEHWRRQEKRRHEHNSVVRFDCAALLEIIMRYAPYQNHTLWRIPSVSPFTLSIVYVSVRLCYNSWNTFH